VAYGEEEAFRRTLATGTTIFDLAADKVLAGKGTLIGGEDAFKLHDTYGFPIDLTVEMAQEAGLEVDRAEFDRLMAEQRDRAKADAKAKKGGTLATEAYRELRVQGETPFLGYTELAVETSIRGIVADGAVARSAQSGSIVEVVLAETPFYAEAGGQDADTGLISSDAVSLEVLDVQKPVDGLVAHRVRVADGELRPGMRVLAAVDARARLESCRAHTATHIVNAGLRQLLGATTAQAGSYNKPGYLRFDFTSAVALTAGMREELEGVSNAAILADHEVTATQLPKAEAVALGAQAMFGEKYGEVVRMVELAGPWSRELCGGTHVERTAQIGLLNLLGESSVGSGIRRVEALVSADAFQALSAERALVNGLAGYLRVQPDQLFDRVTRLAEQLKAAERELAGLRAAQLLARVPELAAGARRVGAVGYVAESLSGVSADDLRSLATAVRAELGATAGVVALVGGDAKPALVVATTAAARELGAKAGALVRVGAVPLGGKGGGKDDLAQGGGTDAAGAQAALDEIAGALGALR
jgi:alanyl-tRNA synthetase